MADAKAKAQAFDASARVENGPAQMEALDRQRRKLRSAVDYHERELAAAQRAVDGTTAKLASVADQFGAKVESAKGRAATAESELTAAKEALDTFEAEHPEGN